MENTVFKISLAAARTNAGLSQKSAAEQLGVTGKTLCNWENGKSFPDQPMIEKICALYQVPYDFIKFRAN